MSKFYSGLFGVVGAAVVAFAGWAAPALAMGNDVTPALVAPAAGALGDAVPYLEQASDSVRRALTEATVEVDPTATLQELDDAQWSLDEARARLLASVGRN